MPPLLAIGWDGVLQTFCPGWPWNVIFPISASQVARITDCHANFMRFLCSHFLQILGSNVYILCFSVWQPALRGWSAVKWNSYINTVTWTSLPGCMATTSHLGVCNFLSISNHLPYLLPSGIWSWINWVCYSLAQNSPVVPSADAKPRFLQVGLSLGLRPNVGLKTHEKWFLLTLYILVKLLSPSGPKLSILLLTCILPHSALDAQRQVL
jgi:hypothetical protein